MTMNHSVFVLKSPATRLGVVGANGKAKPAPGSRASKAGMKRAGGEKVYQLARHPQSGQGTVDRAGGVQAAEPIAEMDDARIALEWCSYILKSVNCDWRFCGNGRTTSWRWCCLDQQECLEHFCRRRQSRLLASRTCRRCGASSLRLITHVGLTAHSTGGHNP